MTGEAEDRLRGGVLVATALLVLAGGGWWWQSAAPAAGPPPRPAALRSVDADPERVRDELLAADPRASVRIHVGADGRILDQTVLPAQRRGPDIGLPWFTDTLWRDRLVLVPGRPPERRDALPDGAAHLFQYRCSGPGVLALSIWRGPLPQHRRVPCDGGFAEVELSPQPQPLRLDLASVGPGAIEVEAQLVAVP